jgi:catechol 2,3-dioxygenase
MTQASREVPALVFSHFGFHCQEITTLEPFYTQVLGFAVSDSGPTGPGWPMSFMTRRPWEHHQLVLAGLWPRGMASTVQQTGFLATDLGELRRIKARLETEDGVSAIATADHGIAWALYFRDPQGHRCSISVATPWYVPQPAYWPLDLSDSDAAITARTEQQCRASEGFMMRRDWAAQTKRMLAESGRLASQAIPSVEEKVAPTGATIRRPKGIRQPADPFPKIAMNQIGVYVCDLDRMRLFYEQTLGYLVTGVGRMPAIGPEPAANCVYLTRDPSQVAQLILVSGRPPGVSSNINQITFRVPDLPSLRKIDAMARATNGCSNFRPVNHGNSYSLYFEDPEGNSIEVSYESEWYVPAPSAWPLDLSLDDATLEKQTEAKCRAWPGFMLRDEWKAKSRADLSASGRLEAEELVEHLY